MSSETPQPPTADAALYAHYPLVTDALVNGGAVTDRTLLAGLYRFDDTDVDNRLLKNTTSICDIKVRCQVLLDSAAGSGVLPPTLNKGQHGYDVFCTFNLLAIAPSLRIEVYYMKQDDSVPLKLALEFPFNDRCGKQLHDFEHRDDDGTGHADIRFSSTGATSEGFTLITGAHDQLSESEKDAVRMLRSLEATSEAKQLHLILQTQEMTPSDQADLQKLIARLPGGSGLLLPSIGVPEWSNYPIGLMGIMPTPKELMELRPPNPMVPLDAPQVFHSVHHFTVDQLGCAAMSQRETDKMVLEWAMRHHEVALYALRGKLPVIGMKFAPLPSDPLHKATLGRLPNELEIKIRFDLPGIVGVEYTAARDIYMQGLPEHDAYFTITSHKVDWFKGHLSSGGDIPHYRQVRTIVPHPNTFLLQSFSDAVMSLAEPRHHKFHPIALGNDFDSLEEIDVTSGFDISATTKESAWDWLINYKSWNQAQLRLIMQLKGAKGGVTLATGTAGTGKTTLQMAMAVYFVRMGGRAACLATSNTNVAMQADALQEIKKAIRGSDIRVIRIISTSRGIGSRHTSAAQAVVKRTGHYRGTVCTMYGLQFLRHDQRVGNMEDWAHTLELCMLEEAGKQQLSIGFRYSCGSRVDAWEEFRRYLVLSVDETFWEEANDHEIKKYAQIFEACKGHLIGLADIILSTNGNAQCSDLKKHWACVDNIKRLGVFVDEVGREVEISVWNSILSKGLPRVPDFVMLLGDPKQLTPTNPSVTERLQCNPFASRGDLSMLDRLISLGFPCLNLDVQQRMHPALSKFPAGEFYESGLQNKPGAARILEDVEPGLKVVLDRIIAKSYDQKQAAEQEYMSCATDEQTRLHYLDFGKQQEKYKRASKAIPKHVKAVFDKVFLALQQHFGDRTYQEVMIIAAYSTAVNQYHKEAHDLQELQGRDDSHYPRIFTIDNAQGQEASVVIADCSMQGSKLPKFLTDRGRCNVAMTRAKEVFWMVGGPLATSPEPLSPFPKLYKEMHLRGQVHSFKLK